VRSGTPVPFLPPSTLMFYAHDALAELAIPRPCTDAWARDPRDKCSRGADRRFGPPRPGTSAAIVGGRHVVVTQRGLQLCRSAYAIARDAPTLVCSGVHRRA